MTMYRQIWLLAAIRAIRMFMITMPIIVLYWQSHGLLLRDIFILQVVYSISIVLFELPSGYFADRFGHRLSLILGSMAGAIGFFTYWAFPSYAGFLVAEVVLALSAGFMSGARDALLYDTLEHFKADALYTKWQGRLMAIGNASEAVAAVAAGIVASLSSIATVLLVQWIVMIAAIPCAFALTNVPAKANAIQKSLREIVRFSLRENKRLRFLTLYAGGLSASTLTMVWFIQPHWEMLGVNILYFGYLWAGLNLIVGLGSLMAHKVETWLRFRTLFGIMAIAPLVLYGLTAYFSATLLVLMVTPLFWLLRGVSNPLIQDYVQRECAAGERATVLSINALATRLIFSIFSPFLGWIGDIWGLQTAFLASGLVFGVITIAAFAYLLTVWRPVRV